MCISELPLGGDSVEKRGSPAHQARTAEGRDAGLHCGAGLFCVASQYMKGVYYT